MEELGISLDLQNPQKMLTAAENLVQEKFPSEFVTPFI